MLAAPAPGIPGSQFWRFVKGKGSEGKEDSFSVLWCFAALGHRSGSISAIFWIVRNTSCIYRVRDGASAAASSC